MSNIFLHESENFKDLIELTASFHKVDPYLIEKDYWLMHVLWSLQNLNFEFQLKGGTSLSKGFGVIHRFSEDIDIKIVPEASGYKTNVYQGKNHDKEAHRKSRKDFYDWISNFLSNKISGVVHVKRDTEFDETPKYRSGGIRLLYQTIFQNPGSIKDGILLEAGFAETTPNISKLISSWAYDYALNSATITFKDNQAKNILCYDPRYTFVEKLSAVSNKYRNFKKDENKALEPNFLRHYYDLFQLLQLPEVQAFIGTAEYGLLKEDRFGSNDTELASNEAFKLSDPKERAIFESAFIKSKTLYYKGQPKFETIIEQLAKDAERL